MSRLDDIKARMKHATPGPWITRTTPHPLGGVRHAVEVVEDSPLYSLVATADARDADLIAHAREDLVWLVQELGIQTQSARDAHEERDHVAKLLSQTEQDRSAHVTHFAAQDERQNEELALLRDWKARALAAYPSLGPHEGDCYCSDCEERRYLERTPTNVTVICPYCRKAFGTAAPVDPAARCPRPTCRADHPSK